MQTTLFFSFSLSLLFSLQDPDSYDMSILINKDVCVTGVINLQNFSLICSGCSAEFWQWWQMWHCSDQCILGHAYANLAEGSVGQHTRRRLNRNSQHHCCHLLHGHHVWQPAAGTCRCKFMGDFGSHSLLSSCTDYWYSGVHVMLHYTSLSSFSPTYFWHYLQTYLTVGFSYFCVRWNNCICFTSIVI